MRLITLLDSYERTPVVSPQQAPTTDPTAATATSASPPASTPAAPTPAAPLEPSRSTAVTASTFRNSNAQFNDLLDGLLPCRIADSELWFAEQARDAERAKTLCQACPLQTGCLQGALDRGEPWGVWGGEILIDGQIVAAKRGRGRPRKPVAD